MTNREIKKMHAKILNENEVLEAKRSSVFTLSNSNQKFICLISSGPSGIKQISSLLIYNSINSFIEFGYKEIKDKYRGQLIEPYFIIIPVPKDSNLLNLKNIEEINFEPPTQN